MYFTSLGSRFIVGKITSNANIKISNEKISILEVIYADIFIRITVKLQVQAKLIVHKLSTWLLEFLFLFKVTRGLPGSPMCK